MQHLAAILRKNAGTAVDIQASHDPNSVYCKYGENNIKFGKSGRKMGGEGLETSSKRGS